jgi:FMN phosphatase YigB (HAD superfamily)
MINTLFLDIGGTLYIKNNQGEGMLNPALVELLEKIPSFVHVVIVSDTEIFNIKDLLARDFPSLHPYKLFIKKDYPWMKKTNPETYFRIMKRLGVDANQCALVDNQEDFRQAAKESGILTFDIQREEIKRLLHSWK